MTAKQNLGATAPDGSLYITLTDGAGNLVDVGSAGTITQADVTGLTTADSPTFAGLTLSGGTLSGNLSLSGSLTSSNYIYLTGSGSLFQFSGFSTASAVRTFGWGSANDAVGTNLSSPAASTLQFGRPDNASPAPQTIRGVSVVAGTSNTAGPNLTFQAPTGTGTGAGGSFIFQVAPAGADGTAQNARVTALTIDHTKLVTFGGAIQMASIPTVDPHVAGRVWNNSNILTVSAG